MKEPVVAQYKPYRVSVQKGERYLWCSCGLSKTQPFCDKSHVGTDFKPLAFTTQESRAVLFCGCKHSAAGAICDGSHNNLADEYAEDERSLEEVLAGNSEVPFDASGRAVLDGGCYVQRPASLAWKTIGGVEMASVISSADKARFLDQYYLRLSGDSSEVLQYPGVDVVLFCTSGEGRVIVAGRSFEMMERVGVHVRSGEAFQLYGNDKAALQCLVTVCPGGTPLQVLEVMPANFDTNFDRQAVAYDESQRVTMADRFYQVLVGEDVGSAEVTQFIGQIPQSKAAPHRHLYEEAIVILSARGMMWTETRRAAVAPGDLIFLPAEQEHSLQCTEESGMELAGHFYPSGSPSINY